MVRVISTSFIPRDVMESNPELYLWNETNSEDLSEDHSNQPAVEQPTDDPDRKGVRLL